MRTTIISTAIAVLALPAVAGSIQGTWASNPADCGAVYPETQVEISGSKISFIESSCKLENPTDLRDMPDAKLYDVVCSGEGESWSERALIGMSGDDLLIYSRGFARTYESC